MLSFQVLGPVRVVAPDGVAVDLRGPRHREVLARLLAADDRVVPLDRLIDDLWDEPPANATGAVRTFVAALRRALEPDRPPRTPSRLLTSEGTGYALRAGRDAVDSRRFEDALSSARTASPRYAVDAVNLALGWWRGSAYADFPDAYWARAQRRRLDELRLQAAEVRAAAQLDLGAAGPAIADLETLVAESPWREDAWRLLAVALYRDSRQGDALAALKRAKDLLAGQLGVDAGGRLRQLEVDLLNHAAHLQTAQLHGGDTHAATALYERTVTPGSRTHLRSTVDLLRTLAVTSGPNLVAARQERLAAILAAERTGDADLTARIIGGFDVPAIWSRSDDPDQARQVVAAAERTLTALGPSAADSTRARLLATIAVESRANAATRGLEAAEEAEQLARRLGDPAVLAFALNGRFMQSFRQAGQALARDAIGAEIVELSARHGLTTYEILGHLIRLQARSAAGDLDGADGHATAAERLARHHEAPLVTVFTDWFRCMKAAATGEDPVAVARAYRTAAERLPETGMPGFADGLPALARLSICLLHSRPAPTDPGIGWGAYAPWCRPLALVASGHHDQARTALASLPAPPPDHFLEVRWCLAGHAAVAVGNRRLAAEAYEALRPAAGELLGAGSGVLTLGRATDWLKRL
ncbi:BTAD domain-containing putative transcriptional regulator [Fodinicola acaciae]|uniref:BTAD domain-containing putative transcriptional regulator n=1 Tax=Fodinicola acaciae TaxID=2681555 RepID=UPI001FE3265B|nr:BTAD domain-containing putative transcriptional regulator [Fodinicola acaciae]